jgi:hypothetical protein
LKYEQYFTHRTLFYIKEDHSIASVERMGLHISDYMTHPRGWIVDAATREPLSS